jgi:hypothetical protein
MNIKLTVYLTAVLTLAIVAVVFVINPKHKAAEKLHVRKVFNINNIGNVNEIDIRNKNGDFVIKKDTNGHWLISYPVNTDADTTVIGTLLSSFETLRYGKEIGNGTPAALGLSPASITATVTLSNKQIYGLQIGSAAPLGKYSYAVAKNGIPGIFTIAGGLRKQLDSTLFQLRNKSLIKLTQNDIASISFIKDSKPVYTLKKEKKNWVFTKPSYNRLKTSVFDEMAFQLTNMNATNIIDDVTDLKGMGLEKPLEVISIVLMDNKKYNIEIGKNVDKNSVYAMVTGRPEVYVIDKYITAVFETPVRDMYRNNGGDSHDGKR